MPRIPTLFEEREFDLRLVACADAVPARTDDAMRSFGFDQGTQDWRRVMDDPSARMVTGAVIDFDQTVHGPYGPHMTPAHRGEQ